MMTVKGSTGCKLTIFVKVPSVCLNHALARLTHHHTTTVSTLQNKEPDHRLPPWELDFESI